MSFNIVSAKKKLFIILFGFFLLLPSNNSFAKLTSDGNRYYFYFGLGGALGGFGYNFNTGIAGEYCEPVQNQPPNCINGSTAFDLSYESGFASNGITGGLQGHVGFEYRTRSHFYFAAEVYGSAMFNQNSITLGDTSQSLINENIFILEFATVNSSFSLNGAGNRVYETGTNAFSGLYGNIKLGYTNSADTLAAYFIIGGGYEYMPATGVITACYIDPDLVDGEITGCSDLIDENTPPEDNPYLMPNFIRSFSFNLGGGKLTYGAGLSYYFTQNFGFFTEFIMTSPIKQKALSGANLAWDPIFCIDEDGNECPDKPVEPPTPEDPDPDPDPPRSSDLSVNNIIAPIYGEINPVMVTSHSYVLAFGLNIRV